MIVCSSAFSIKIHSVVSANQVVSRWLSTTGVHFVLFSPCLRYESSFNGSNSTRANGRLSTHDTTNKTMEKHTELLQWKLVERCLVANRERSVNGGNCLHTDFFPRRRWQLKTSHSFSASSLDARNGRTAEYTQAVGHATTQVEIESGFSFCFLRLFVSPSPAQKKKGSCAPQPTKKRLFFVSSSSRASGMRDGGGYCNNYISASQLKRERRYAFGINAIEKNWSFTSYTCTIYTNKIKYMFRDVFPVRVWMGKRANFDLTSGKTRRSWPIEIR